jgi:hypothetical protein
LTLEGHALHFACGIITCKIGKMEPALMPVRPSAGQLEPSSNGTSLVQAARRRAPGLPAMASSGRKRLRSSAMSPALAPVGQSAARSTQCARKAPVAVSIRQRHSSWGRGCKIWHGAAGGPEFAGPAAGRKNLFAGVRKAVPERAKSRKKRSLAVIAHLQPCLRPMVSEMGALG